MVKRVQLSVVFLYCLLIALAYLLVCSKASPLYPINDWTDANAFFSCGKGMLAGRVLYRDLYEHKGPLLYALHALCAMFDSADFTAVYVLEALSLSLFLLAAYRLLTLYGARRTAPFALPLMAAAVLTSISFQQGDSAEELCLPLLLWSLYFVLRWARERAPRRMSASLLIVNGAMLGCVFWIKFTLVGFYVPWVAGLFTYHAVRRQWREAFACVLWFALGAMAATLPWLVYFGVNGAVGDWLKTYLYDNLFLYGGGSAGFLAHVKAVARAVYDWFIINLAYTLPTLIGLLAFVLTPGPVPSLEIQPVKRFERNMVWLTAGFTGLFVFIGGKAYVYYGLMLAAFVPFGTLYMLWEVEALPPLKRPLRRACLVALTLLMGLVCLAATPNRTDLLRPREQTMQYRFAALIDQTPNATLLNYGFMDAGFYTAAHITPSIKYFHRTNMPLREMTEEQARYVAEGVTDYVVARAALPENIAARYTLVATADAPAGFWYSQVYLYRRNGLTR